MNKILVIDDSVSMRKMLGFFLKKNGYSYIEAENGKDGLQKLYSNKDVVLIIVDVNMPIMDGFSFVKKVREKEEYEDFPIYFLTTETLVTFKKKGKEAGANGWLTKPVREDKLIGLVEHVFKKLNIKKG